MVWNDICQRAPSVLFLKSVSATVPSGGGKTSEVIDIALASYYTMNNPALLVFQTIGSNIIYIPRFVTMVDYARTAHNTSGTVPLNGTVPMIWSIGGNEDSTQGKARIFMYPSMLSGGKITVFYTSKFQASPLSGVSFVPDFPYHFEHVLVWGAAALGAKVLMPESYPIFRGEYEQALRNMYITLNYQPDSTPVLRSINGPYDRTPLMMAPPRFPQNIS
jgi:hypothetical protein